MKRRTLHQILPLLTLFLAMFSFPIPQSLSFGADDDLGPSVQQPLPVVIDYLKSLQNQELTIVLSPLEVPVAPAFMSESLLNLIFSNGAPEAGYAQAVVAFDMNQAILRHIQDHNDNRGVEWLFDSKQTAGNFIRSRFISLHSREINREVSPGTASSPSPEDFWEVKRKNPYFSAAKIARDTGSKSVHFLVYQLNRDSLQQLEEAITWMEGVATEARIKVSIVLGEDLSAMTSDEVRDAYGAFIFLDESRYVTATSKNRSLSIIRASDAEDIAVSQLDLIDARKNYFKKYLELNLFEMKDPKKSLKQTQMLSEVDEAFAAELIDIRYAAQWTVILERFFKDNPALRPLVRNHNWSFDKLSFLRAIEIKKPASAKDKIEGEILQSTLDRLEEQFRQLKKQRNLAVLQAQERVRGLYLQSVGGLCSLPFQI